MSVSPNRRPADWAEIDDHFIDWVQVEAEEVSDPEAVQPGRSDLDESKIGVAAKTHLVARESLSNRAEPDEANGELLTRLVKRLNIEKKDSSD